MSNNNEYMKEYMSKRRGTRRQKLLEMAGGSCKTCHSNDNVEFHHLDRSTKLFSLSGKGLDRSWESVIEEFNKCELLCKSCHLERTKEQYATGSILPWNKGSRGEYSHGTPRTYQDTGCRCGPCKDAKRMYRDGVVRYDGSLR